MRKILSLSLALVMLMLYPTIAEIVTLTQTLTSPKGDYSIDVPDDFLSIDAEFVVNLISSPEMQETVAQALGMEDISLLSMYIDMISENNMMTAYTSDLEGTINVQVVESTLTMEMVSQLKSALDAVMVEQYVAVGVAEHNIQLLDIQEIGGRQWYGLRLVMADVQVQPMMTVENGVQYTVTFTDVDEDVLTAIVGSFRIIPSATESR